MSALRGIAIVLVTAAATFALGLASRAPYSERGADQSVLRLSWRLRGEKLQSCRQRSEAELEALPAHMRTPQVCTGHLISYRLVVRIDGAVDTLIYAPAGAKGDRPIFVLHDVPLSPGRHEVEVDFNPVERVPGVLEKRLQYHASVNARRGRIEMITLARDASQLVLVD
jgi:hypothetical protein